MSEKQKFYGVFITGEDEPRAVFLTDTDASMYNYVRFGTDGLAHVCQLQNDKIQKVIPKSIYKSLPFQEGVAFNRIMKMRREKYQKERKRYGGP